MKKYLVGLVGLAVLSGCVSLKVDSYNRGWRNGKEACEKGKKAADESYERGFYLGFLFQNLKKN
jgi:hypothetical protein